MQDPATHCSSEPKDRRRFTRFTPKNGTVAVNDHTLGPIVNISMGGLAFQCMDDDNSASRSNHFGIFLGSDDILIDGIQSQIVSSSRLKTPKNAFMQTKIRQLSIQFLNLSSMQQKKLKNFILTKARGVA
jgi:c-di-GMP-binding flagellar brake protein YcgR